MPQKIWKRSEVPEPYTWDLTVLFDSNDAWMKEYEALQLLPDRIISFAGTLANSADQLFAYLKFQDILEVRLSVFCGYASCKNDEDTADGFYNDLKGKATATMVALSRAGAFARPEIMAIPEDTLEKFYSEKKELEVYRPVLQRIRRRKEHILSPAEEKLLAAAGEMAQAPDDIAGILRNADLTFPDVTDSSGAVHPLTDGFFVPMLMDPDREFRHRVFQTYYARLAEIKNTVAATLQAQFAQLRFYSEARHYPSTLEASLDCTEVPVSVYTNLIETVHRNLHQMHRYVALRKKLLGVETLHMYDVYTPIVPDADCEIPFSKAKETVLQALQVLGEDYIAMLREGFEHRWIDVYENVGKRSGAYSSGVARPHPFVLLNHKDNLDSLFTLAHEMGHALHSYLSCKNQPVCTSDYVIFVAEVASTCNEVLLMRYLLDHRTDQKQRAYLINHFLDQFKGTLYRQTMFAEFEWKMGRMAEAGKTLTADLLSKTYYELNQLYFGPDMVSDEEIALEWARIPHFFYNYYVFQYATGFSAAVAIANRILAEGEPAVADYKRFLSGGSSADPITLLKIAGVDMSSPEPICNALELFSNLLDEMENLMR